eukprot:TRINITY_DN4572_c0_g1_i1.p1 TRINITY_DN4572_c0_g1~~TRINITY_DN4572_c0_g1_i1.p1  ORF type:complete len:555 (+),score=174.30 TRINITY_DN4572_c0_g1_i1:81-1667(+)
MNPLFGSEAAAAAPANVEDLQQELHRLRAALVEAERARELAEQRAAATSAPRVHGSVKIPVSAGLTKGPLPKGPLPDPVPADAPSPNVAGTPESNPSVNPLRRGASAVELSEAAAAAPVPAAAVSVPAAAVPAAAVPAATGAAAGAAAAASPVTSPAAVPAPHPDLPPPPPGMVRNYKVVTPNGPMVEGKPLLEGTYEMLPLRTFNGAPVWKSTAGGFFIYNGVNGRWHVTDSEDDFPQCVGHIASCPHRGAGPHRVERWQRWQGDGWMDDDGVVVLAFSEAGSKFTRLPAGLAAVLELDSFAAFLRPAAVAALQCTCKALRAAMSQPSVWAGIWRRERVRPVQSADASTSPLELLQGDHVVCSQVAWALGRAPLLTLKPGLSESQFDAAERKYGFTFPPELRLLLRLCVPTGGEWHDWHAVLGGDTDTVQQAIEAHGSPEGARANPLVPLVGTCMMPSVPHGAGNPVYAMHHGTDNTVAGANVWEFLCTHPAACAGDSVQVVVPRSWRSEGATVAEVPFWSSRVVPM